MAFDTFDLGRAISTAEGIKAMRRQSAFDTLREQATRGQIAAQDQSMQINASQEKRAETQYSQEQQINGTRLLNAAAAEIAQDPSDEVIQRWLPQLEQAGIKFGANPMAVPPEVRQQFATKLYHSTSAALASLNPKGPEDLVQTVGADGKPVYTPKSKAVGQTPYIQPKDDTPSSYDEFIRAQKDPGFAEFLKSRRGKGFSVTTPDGTVIEMGGEGGKVDAGELTKPTINNLQETIVKSTDRLDRLNATLSKYNPDFLRAKGIASAATTKAKDFLGLGVSEDQRKYLDEYSQFTSSAATDLAQFLKDMSGAAVTPQEYERTEKALPSGKEFSPVEFEAKTKVALKTINRAIMRANWALKNGIGVQSVEQLSKVMPLESIDTVYEQRANEIWQGLGGKPETKAQAVAKANQEFGIAR